MNNNEEISIQFLEDAESYLNGTMTLAEKAAFDEKLHADPVFRSQFEKTKGLILGIESAVLKDQLQEFHNTMGSDDSVRSLNQTNTSTYIWIGIAASIIAVLGIFLFFNENSSSDRLFAAHFVPDPGLPTTMSSTSEYRFYEAMVDYKQENYKTAIQKWETLLPEKPQNDTLNYFLGVAQLADGNSAYAIQFLEKPSIYNSSAFKDDVKFYLGLAYLKSGDINKAKENLSQSNLPEAKAALNDINE